MAIYPQEVLSAAVRGTREALAALKTGGIPGPLSTMADLRVAVRAAEYNAMDRKLAGLD